MVAATPGPGGRQNGRFPVYPSPDHAVDDTFRGAIDGAIVVLFGAGLPRLWWRSFFATRGV